MRLSHIERPFTPPKPKFPGFFLDNLYHKEVLANTAKLRQAQWEKAQAAIAQRQLPTRPSQEAPGRKSVDTLAKTLPGAPTANIARTSSFHTTTQHHATKQQYQQQQYHQQQQQSARVSTGCHSGDNGSTNSGISFDCRSFDFRSFDFCSCNFCTFNFRTFNFCSPERYWTLRTAFRLGTHPAATTDRKHHSRAAGQAANAAAMGQFHVSTFKQDPGLTPLALALSYAQDPTKRFTIVTGTSCTYDSDFGGLKKRDGDDFGGALPGVTMLARDDRPAKPEMALMEGNPLSVKRQCSWN
ncbi:hypothetical protein LTR65_007232 [Meristemomyces frigidus]